MEAGLAGKQRYYDSVAKDWRWAYHYLDHVIRTELVVQAIAPGRPWLTERQWLARRARLAPSPTAAAGSEQDESWLAAAARQSNTAGTAAVNSAPDAVIPGEQGDTFVELDLGQYTSAQIKGKLAMAASDATRLIFVVPGPNRAAKIARMAVRSLPRPAWPKIVLATLDAKGGVSSAQSAADTITTTEQRRSG